MSDWVEHDGSGKPDLPGETKVQVRWPSGGNCGSPEDAWTVDDWCINWEWDDRNDCEANIVAYRVVTV